MDLMTIDVGPVSASIYTEHDRQAHHIAEGRGYEPASLEAWASIVKPGMVAVDVGAYSGLYSIVAAKLGAQVVALEPMPANRLRIERNLELNGIRGVQLLDVAASDHGGLDELFFNPKVPLTTGASLKKNDLHGASMTVRCVELDALALTSVAAIKIDVEWYEAAVIKGGLKTISRYRPMLLVETLDAEMREIVQQLLPGYDAVAILDGRNTMFAPSEGRSSWASPSQAPLSSR